MAVGINDVITAADTIYKAGEYPTHKSVRDLLGNTGSYTTIGKGLRVWREKHGEISRVPLDEAAAAIGQVIDIKAIMAIAGTYARRQFEAERTAGQAKTAALEKDLADALQRNELLEMDIRAEKQKTASLQNQITELNVKLVRYEEQIDGLVRNELGLHQRADKSIELRLKAERALVASEEKVKLLDKQAEDLKRQFSLLEGVDESSQDANEILVQLLKRINQAGRLFDRLTYEAKRDKSRISAIESAKIEFAELNKKVGKTKEDTPI